jgi:tetratricopeptide (TPR) repeat protein
MVRGWLALLGCGFASLLAPAASRDIVREALDLYARGEHVAAVALPPATLDVDVLTGTAGLWIHEAGNEAVDARRTAAAAYVLEAVWAATRTADNAFSDPRDCAPHPDGPAVPISSCRAIPSAVAWGCAAMSGTDGHGEAAAWWWRASVGMLEDARAWAELTGTRGRPRHPDANLARESAEGHLAHAEVALPGEPRWRLAGILARAALDVRPAPWSPLRQDVLRDRSLGNPGGGTRTDRELAELASAVAELAPEIELHLGYRELQRRRWQPALARLARVEEAASEPFLLAASGYFAGYAYERLGRPGDAIAAYRRAHAHRPRQRNLAFLLAAQLFVDNDRAEAHRVLAAAVAASPEPFDLRTLVDRGGAWLVPGYLARMREALQ